jgi:hypothetical protein
MERNWTLRLLRLGEGKVGFAEALDVEIKGKKEMNLD